MKMCLYYHILLLAICTTTAYICSIEAKSFSTLEDLLLFEKFEQATQLYKQEELDPNKCMEHALNGGKYHAVPFCALNGASLTTCNENKNTIYYLVIQDLYNALDYALPFLEQSKPYYTFNVTKKSMLTLVCGFCLFVSCEDGSQLKTKDDFKKNLILLKGMMDCLISIKSPLKFSEYIATEETPPKCVPNLCIFKKTLGKILFEKEPLKFNAFLCIKDIMILFEAGFGMQQRDKFQENLTMYYHWLNRLYQNIQTMEWLSTVY